MEPSAMVTASPDPTTGLGNQRALANVNQGSQGGNLNFQQPFYRTVAYGPQISPVGNGP
jgi:hypothetical protein